MDGKQLRAIRKMMGMSQRELAQRLYYGKSAVSLMEQDDRRVPPHTATLVWQMLAEREAAIRVYREQHGQTDTNAA